ncbi:hypothetical protein KEM52_002713, partial [Ascosphaera acerosa]
TESCTMIREVAVHTWPWLLMMPKNAHFTACSSSASGKTSSGDLPPVSSVMFFRVPAAMAMIERAVAVEPVKATLSTSLCSQIAAPASAPAPFRMLTTPGGNPASLTSLAKYRMLRGVASAGLSNTALPHARAGPSFQHAIDSG